jgi:lysozyme
MTKYQLQQYDLDKIKEFEGFASNAYKCPAGAWTCGFGTTKGVTSTTRCTRSEAEQWLKRDLTPIEVYLNTIPEIDTYPKFASLCDFCYNLGLGNLKSSTLLRKIKAGASTEDIQEQFRRWVYAGGKVLKGLVKRREWEAQRWAE